MLVSDLAPLESEPRPVTVMSDVLACVHVYLYSPLGSRETSWVQRRRGVLGNPGYSRDMLLGMSGITVPLEIPGRLLVFLPDSFFECATMPWSLMGASWPNNIIKRLRARNSIWTCKPYNTSVLDACNCLTLHQDNTHAPNGLSWNKHLRIHQRCLRQWKQYHPIHSGLQQPLSTFQEWSGLTYP